MRTLQELAQGALDIPEVCNISGLANEFASAMRDLRTHVKGEALQVHPIAQVWADRIAQITCTNTGIGSDGCGASDFWDDVYDKVRAIAEGEE